MRNDSKTETDRITWGTGYIAIDISMETHCRDAREMEKITDHSPFSLESPPLPSSEEQESQTNICTSGSNSPTFSTKLFMLSRASFCWAIIKLSYFELF